MVSILIGKNPENHPSPVELTEALQHLPTAAGALRGGAERGRLAAAGEFGLGGPLGLRGEKWGRFFTKKKG